MPLSAGMGDLPTVPPPYGGLYDGRLPGGELRLTPWYSTEHWDYTKFDADFAMGILHDDRRAQHAGRVGTGSRVVQPGVDRHGVIRPSVRC